MTYFDFRNIGMEPRDKRVYEALYKLNQGSLRSIAEVTGLNRGTVYDVVKKLTNVGLVTFTEVGARRYYTASKPEVLISLLHERRNQLQGLEEVAANYAAALESRKELPGAGQFVNFYEGYEGYSAILRDVIQTTRRLEVKEYRVISASRISQYLYQDFEGFSKARAKEGIFAKVIADSPFRGKVVQSERRLWSTRFSSYVIIYDGKTAIFSMDEDRVPAAVVITDKAVAQTQRQMFDNMWDSLDEGVIG